MTTSRDLNMPPPTGYLRFADMCDQLNLSRNTVYAAIARAKEDGIDLEPVRVGNTTLYTAAQAEALRKHRNDHATSHSLIARDH